MTELPGRPEPDLGPVSALLRAQRAAAGLSQRELARAAGLSVAAVRDLEQGRRRRPQASSIRPLAAALGLDDARLRELAAVPPRPAARRPPGRTAPGLRLQLLGPVAAWRDGAAVGLGPPRQRAVLAVLALEPGQPVSRAAIIDALWGDRPPKSAVNLIQTYASRLRRVLRPAMPGPAPRLFSAGRSYQLDVCDEQLDLARFRALAGQARSAPRPAAAAAAARLALDLWHGDPLADLPALQDYPPVIGLAEERRAVLVDYAGWCEALGRSDEVLPLLRVAAASHALDERVHGALMTALAATGRPAQALQVHHDLRQRLSAELGISPGAELSRRHERILQAEPARRPQEAPDRDAPRQLPRGIAAFIGRAADLDSMTSALDQADRDGAQRPVWVISGPAGVGKSSLALHWAHGAAARFPDGQVFVNLRGFHPGGSPATQQEVIRDLLGLLRVPAEQVPASLAAQLSLYRSLLARRRMLIILDNARDAAHARDLLPPGPGCTVIVTSRDRLVGLAAGAGARLAELGPLTGAEAGQLLARGLSGAALAAEPAAAEEIIRLCDRLPLALAIVVARAQSRGRRGTPLAALAAELRGPARLDGLDAGDAAVDVRAVLSWSYRTLSPAAARVFRLLGLHAGPDIGGPALASLAGLDLARALVLARELTRLHLVTEPAPQRFALHDLLRAYAVEALHAAEPPERRRRALHRVLDHYLHTAHAAALAVNPARDPLRLAPPQAGAAPEPVAGPGQAAAWFRAEYPVLRQAIDLAAAHGFDEHAWRLPWTLVNYFDRRGHWQDWIDTHQTALAAARRRGSAAGQASSHQNISIVYVNLGRYDDAWAHLQEAIILNCEIGAQPGQARCLLDISRSFESQGHHGHAVEAARAALGVYETLGHEAGQGRALNAIGWNSAHLGDCDQGIKCCEQALEIHARMGNRMGQAATLDSLGYAHARLGQHAEAIRRYEQARDLLGRGERTYQCACVLTNLGASHHAAGNPAAAAAAWQEALFILRDLGHPDARHVLAQLSGRAAPRR